MTAPTYLTTCICCGAQLAPVAQLPSAPPWMCRWCMKSWWASELSALARAAYRADRGDFHPLSDVRTLVAEEAREASVRGTSLRVDQLDLMSAAGLQGVARLRLATDFADAVAARLFTGGSS